MRKVIHLGLIPDGGRRWALRERVRLEESYHRSMLLIADCLDCVFLRGVQIVTIYMLSKANLQRTETDLRAVLSEEEFFIRELLPPICSKWDAKAKIAGTLGLLPEPWKYLDVIIKVNKSTTNRKINLCIAYDPFLELQFAVKNCGEKTDPANVLSKFWITDRLDLIVRTGGANTLSDFVPLQAGYARIIFLEELFNDIKPDQILRLIHEHEMLDLKFGE